MGVDNNKIKEWENEVGTLESEYIICVIDTYYDNWATFDGTGALYNEYIAKTREEIKKDPVEYETITSFLPEYITKIMRVDNNFKGIFYMSFDKPLYT